MSALTLPGTIPGLLRRGSPVRFRSDTLGDMEATIHQVYESAPGFVAVTFAASGQEYALQGAAADAALDLTDATGRAHAAWWLLDRYKSGALVGNAGSPLDPNDPRRLPDGSRWVDAEALRRVCLHVAKVQQ